MPAVKFRGVDTQSPLDTASHQNLPLNAVHEFVLRMFPDGRELWTVAEILSACSRAYDTPGDLTWNTGKIRNAINALRARREEFPDCEFRELTATSGYRYPPESCRLIVREVINGRLPKNFQPKRDEKRDENSTKTLNAA